eukprot:gene38881-47294_t
MALSRLKDDAAFNRQIEEVRERIDVLKNDRRTNVDLLESNKSANKEEIKRLREENKELRQKTAQLSRTMMFEEEHEEQKHVEREVEKLRKMYDDLKVQSTRQKKELDHLKDAVKDLELNSQRPHMEDNEYTRTIRQLENKLDKAMIKYNEAMSIKKTYEQIVRRLSEERVGFDNQMSAIERTVRSKERDLEELILLAGDAVHARDTALQELERVRAYYEDERRRRDKELRERHQTISARKAMLERIQHREKLRQQMTSAGAGGKTAGDLGQSGGLQDSQTLLLEKIESRNKVSIFENAFRKIKEATGVSDVNEVISKIVSQESSTENLISVTRENQQKIEALQEMKRKIKAHCEELKYSGVGGGQQRKMVDSYEDQLAQSSTRLERARLKYDRLSKIAIAMKAGVGHLQDKLEAFRDEVGGKSFVVSDETVGLALQQCELLFETLLKRIKASEDEVRRYQMLSLGQGHGQDFLAGDLAQLEEKAGALQSLRPFNQRIDLTLAQDALAGGNLLFDSLGDNDSLGDLDEDELTRDKVKRASTQILLAMDKKKKKPKKAAASAKDKSNGGGGGGAGAAANDAEDRATSANSPNRKHNE